MINKPCTPSSRQWQEKEVNSKLSKDLSHFLFTVSLCSQLVNGEMYPPTVSEVPVHMVYPEGIPPEKRLVIGQEIFGILPGLTMYATIWLREHNRVCDILKAEHPTWDDEQLFQTTRLIIIGELQVCVIMEKSSFSVLPSLLPCVTSVDDISLSCRGDNQHHNRRVCAASERLSAEAEV